MVRFPDIWRAVATPPLAPRSSLVLLLICTFAG